MRERWTIHVTHDGYLDDEQQPGRFVQVVPASEVERLREAVGQFLEVCDQYGCSIGRGAGVGHETLDGLRAAFENGKESR